MTESGSSESPSASLRRHDLKPRKRLGQNFLRDSRYVDRVLEAADIGTEDEVLEVGSGTGVLTRAVVSRAGRVVAIELDDRLAAMLREEFDGTPNVEIWHGNALDFDPCRHFPGPYTLVGNIPYYITGPILRHFLESTCSAKAIVLMVQREVAERIVAAPGDLSLLGVSVQFYAQPRIVTRVPAGAFYPRPKVDSAIVLLRPHGQEVDPKERDCFFQLARAGFGTRRKTLLNALCIGLNLGREEARLLLERGGIQVSRRAETLSVDDWKRLARVWTESTDPQGGM